MGVNAGNRRNFWRCAIRMKLVENVNRLFYKPALEECINRTLVFWGVTWASEPTPWDILDRLYNHKRYTDYLALGQRTSFILECNKQLANRVWKRGKMKCAKSIAWSTSLHLDSNYDWWYPEVWRKKWCESVVLMQAYHILTSYYK